MTELAPVIPLRAVQSFDPWLSKTQLANHIGYSRRWIELRVREGMPSRRLPNGQRRFRLSEVNDWLERRAA